MGIHVRGYRCLVKPDEVETTTESGIVLAVNTKLEQAAQIYGTLVDAGADCWADTNEQTYATAGDRVVFCRYAGKVVVDPETDEEYYVLNDTDIIAVITGDKK